MAARRPLVLVAGVPAELPTSDALAGAVAYTDTFGLGVATQQAALDLALAAAPFLLSASGEVLAAADGTPIVRS